MEAIMSIEEELASMDNQMVNAYRVGDLRKAFNKCCDPNDWKGPIAVSVPGEIVMLVVEAIKFYTATVPTVRLNTNTMQYLIQSEGYRMGPAGDH